MAMTGKRYLTLLGLVELLGTHRLSWDPLPFPTPVSRATDAASA
jgi:hypothetical protein